MVIVVVLIMFLLSINTLDKQAVSLQAINSKSEVEVEKHFINNKVYASPLDNYDTFALQVESKLAHEAEQELKAKQERLDELARIDAEKRRKAELAEKERMKLAKNEKEIQKINSVTDNKVANSPTNLGTFNVSWYGNNCEGCSGITAAGISVKNTIKYQGYGVAASDWNVIPAFSIIEVEGYGQYIVIDRGGAIKGKKLDLLTTSEAESYKYGRQHLNVKVLRWGK